jgi:hypothetical protein
MAASSGTGSAADWVAGLAGLGDRRFADFAADVAGRFFAWFAALGVVFRGFGGWAGSSGGSTG